MGKAGRDRIKESYYALQVTKKREEKKDPLWLNEECLERHLNLN